MGDAAEVVRLTLAETGGAAPAFICRSDLHHPNLACGRPICTCITAGARTVAEALVRVQACLASPVRQCDGCVVNAGAWAEWRVDAALWRVKSSAHGTSAAVQARAAQDVAAGVLAVRDRLLLLTTGAFADTVLARRAHAINRSLITPYHQSVIHSIDSIRVPAMHAPLTSLQVVGGTSFRVHASVLMAAGRGLAVLCAARHPHNIIRIHPTYAPATWARLLHHIYTGHAPRWPLPLPAALELGVLAARIGVRDLARHITCHVARASVTSIGDLARAAAQTGDATLVHAAAGYILKRLHVVRRAPAWQAIAQCPPVMDILRRRAHRLMHARQKRIACPVLQ